MSFVCIRAGFKRAYDVVNVMDKDNTVETIRTCRRYIKHHLQNANGNLSFQTHKCRNSITGQSSITLQSSSVWIMVTGTAHCCNSKAQLSITGQCLPLKQHGSGECALILVGLCATVSDDEWWTGEDGCILFTSLHVAARIFTLLQYVCQLQTTQTLTHCRGQAG